MIFNLLMWVIWTVAVFALGYLASAIYPIEKLKSLLSKPKDGP